MAKTAPGIIPLTGYALKPRGRRIRELELRSIAPPSGRQYPQDHLTLLYGRDTTLREMSRVHNEAIRNGQQMCAIDVSVNVGRVIVEYATFDDLKRTRFLNMERASKAVLERIQQYWCGYLGAEGRSAAWIEGNVEWRHHRFMSDRPDLVPRLANEEEFAHLALIAYQVVEGQEIYKAGTILDAGSITEVTWAADPQLKVALAPQASGESAVLPP